MNYQTQYSSSPSQVKSVCVFCGSSDAADEHYTVLAQDTGRAIAQASLRLVYGGGGVGLMGATAKAAHHAGGDVLGIIPQFLQSREVTYTDVEHVIVETMHERKTMMYDEADAFIVLPGGLGTLEEAIEVVSWLRMDLHRKPIIFVDRDGYWEPMLALLTHTIDAKFTPEWLRKHFCRVQDPKAALDLIAEFWAEQAALEEPV